MSFLSRIGSALAGFRGKSFSSFAASWIRGDDMVDGASRNSFTRPYAQSAWVYAAVNAIADEIMGRPVEFYLGEVEFDDAAFVEWWNAPALGPKVRGEKQPRLRLPDVLKDLAMWAKLEGEFFLCFDDAWALLTRTRNPAALTPFLIARPDRMRLIIQGGELAGYEYIDAGGKRTVFLPEQVIHWKAANPYDEWRGLGALQAARVAAEGAFLTGTYIRELMRNNGDLGFIVVGKNGVADDAQKAQIVADLRAKRAALKMGQAKDLFLTGDITVERAKEQAASTDLNATKAASQEEIFVAFGVPPSFTTVKAAYSVGKASDYYQLIIRGCQPLGGQIAAVFGEVGSRMTGKPLKACLDWDEHPVMREVRTERVETGLRLWGTGMPMKSVSEYLELGLPEFAGWEVGYLPFSVSPVDAAPPEADPALAEEAAPVGDEDPAVAQLRLLVYARSRQAYRAVPAAVPPVTRDEFAAFRCTCHGCAEAEQKARDPKEVAQWRTLMAQRRETVKSFESAFRRVLMLARAQTLGRIAALAKKGVTQRAAAADLVFELAEFTKNFLGAMEKQQRAALDKSGEQLFRELGKDDPFNYPPPRVLEFLRSRENKLSDAPAQIHADIQAALEEGLNAGDTADQLANRVRGAFNGIADERARAIAMTETSAAYGAGRYSAMVQAGVKYKRWLTSGNDNVRAAHAAANGQTVELNQTFEVGGEQLMHPGDTNGSPENVINCHCVSIAVASPDEA